MLRAEVVPEGVPAVVLALPRGGVPVALPVARGLGAPLGVVLVRKLGVPGRPELAMGAVARVGGAEHVVRNEQVVAGARVGAGEFAAVLAAERAALDARAALLGTAAAVPVVDRTAVLVDDGLATGATVRAAVAAVRAAGAAQVVVAAPYGSPDAVGAVRAVADVVVCPRVPRRFRAVGAGYADFAQVTDEEVRALFGRDEP